MPIPWWSAGVLVAGDPKSCLGAIAIHEEAGVEPLQFLMATESVPHDTVMSSIEMFGKHVIPELKKTRTPRKKHPPPPLSLLFFFFAR